jgi:hypothetical protein
MSTALTQMTIKKVASSEMFKKLPVPTRKLYRYLCSTDVNLRMHDLTAARKLDMLPEDVKAARRRLLRRGLVTVTEKRRAFTYALVQQ